MKTITYSLKYSPWKGGVNNKPEQEACSETTVPRKLFVKEEYIEPYILYKKKSYGTVAGFRVLKEHINEKQIFYFDTAYYYNLIGNTQSRIAFLNYKKPTKEKAENLSYYYYSAALDWTVALIIDNTDIYVPLDDRYIYFILPCERFTKARKKVFLTKEDLKDNINKNSEKVKESYKKTLEKVKETNNGHITMKTQKFKIVYVNSKTQIIPNVKVGDVIYGEITILDNDGHNKLHVSSHYVNYIDLYVNDIRIKQLPMSKFGQMLEYNFKLEKVD